MSIVTDMVNQYVAKVQQAWENQSNLDDFEEVETEYWEDCMWDDYSPEMAVTRWYNFGRYN